MLFLCLGNKTSFPMVGQDTGGRDFLLREWELPEFVIRNNKYDPMMIDKVLLRG